MKHDERLVFLAEGLPIILNSANGFWSASQQLKTMLRESEVLRNHAEEEATKVLIVMDMVRCPKKLTASKLGTLINWFYDHLARLIYVNATSWRPMHMTQLREYVDDTRQAHYLEGEFGEYIAPNWELSERERMLYADIEAYEDEQPMWNAPKGFSSLLPTFTPPALALAQSFAALGMFRVEGLRATAEIWNTVEFKDTQSFGDSKRLTEQLLRRLIDENLPSDEAADTDVSCLYHSWQMPMYNLDFSLLPVPLDALQHQRDSIFYAEMGYNNEDYYY